jgi:hypothetical protein
LKFTLVPAAWYVKVCHSHDSSEIGILNCASKNSPKEISYTHEHMWMPTLVHPHNIYRHVHTHTPTHMYTPTCMHPHTCTCMHMCAHICRHVQMHTPTHVYILACVHTRIHPHRFTRMCAHVHAYMYVHMHTHSAHMCTPTHLYTHTSTCTRTYMHAPTHVYMHACMCVPTHICTHMCMHAHMHTLVCTHAYIHSLQAGIWIVLFRHTCTCAHTTGMYTKLLHTRLEQVHWATEGHFHCG